MRALPPSLAAWTRARAGFAPAYLETYESGALAGKVEAAREALRACRICPRDCDVDRLEDEIGVCRIGRRAVVASAFPHFGEEDCLRGWRGSGTIFFSLCNLRCVFCQNFDISWERRGEEVDARRLAELMLELQAAGCHNINFVTPEHVVPQVLEGVLEAVRGGLRLPIVYNTSGYDSLHSIELLDGVVDVYMPDLKAFDPATAKRLLMAEDYPVRARAAVRAMHRQVGNLVVDEDGLALRGLLIRHLVMPGSSEDGRGIVEWVADELSADTYVNVMDQYRPAGRVTSQPGRYREIERAPAGGEVAAVVEAARAAGLHRLDGRWRSEPGRLALG